MVSRHLRQTVFRLTPGTPEHRALHWHSWDQVEFPETLEKPVGGRHYPMCKPLWRPMWHCVQSSKAATSKHQGACRRHKPDRAVPSCWERQRESASTRKRHWRSCDVIFCWRFVCNRKCQRWHRIGKHVTRNGFICIFIYLIHFQSTKFDAECVLWSISVKTSSFIFTCNNRLHFECEFEMLLHLKSLTFNNFWLL